MFLYNCLIKLIKSMDLLIRVEKTRGALCATGRADFDESLRIEVKIDFRGPKPPYN